ncbi:MAG: VacJ family lipoprotein [Legionella sp.]|nr:VacJ family lipoprotein [Legionella sp.]
MRLPNLLLSVISFFILSGCHKGTNPVDPYESFNRKVNAFNLAVDRALLKPTATVYKKVLPNCVQKGVGNFYNNLDLIPTVVNDLLQAQVKCAYKDTWRFLINSSIGIGGLFDVAEGMSLPPHSNDLGLTFAKWGNKHSPYLVIPLIGPSTLRDGAGLLIQFVLYSPYVFINDDAIMFSLLGLHYIDLRAQFMDSEHLMDEALDKYSFLRDAYLQHRNYLITGTQEDTGDLYVEDAGVGVDHVPGSDSGNGYVDE